MKPRICSLFAAILLVALTIGTPGNAVATPASQPGPTDRAELSPLERSSILGKIHCDGTIDNPHVSSNTAGRRVVHAKIRLYCNSPVEVTLAGSLSGGYSPNAPYPSLASTSEKFWAPKGYSTRYIPARSAWGVAPTSGFFYQASAQFYFVSWGRTSTTAYVSSRIAAV